MTASPSSSRFFDGLITAIPIVLGYFPIAFSFGVAACRSGLTETEAVGLSIIIYAGASQFLALALISGGVPLLVAAVTLVTMNFRHVLYGPALMKRTGPDRKTRWAWLWAFGLTDEVFGAALGAMARRKQFSEPFMFGLSIAAYASWVSGTMLGAFAGGAALEGWPVMDAALGFMLPALFLALLLSIMSKPQLPVIAIAVIATCVVTLLWSGTAGILAGMLAGALAGGAGFAGARDAV